MRGRVAALLLLALAACRSNDGAPANEPATPPTGDDASADAATSDASDATTVACVPSPYPAGPYGTTVGATLADATFTGRSASGAPGAVSLHDVLDTCASPAPVVLVRIGAEWCGTCRWSAENATLLASSGVGARVRFLDVLLRDRDNAPTDDAAAARWQSIQDAPAPVALDPDFTTAALVPQGSPLPYVLVVDARTMAIRDALAMPTEDALEASVAAALAAIDGVTPPSAPAPVLVDGRFTRDEWGLVSAMIVATPPATDTTNAAESALAAVSFGGRIFNDLELAANQNVACSSCHEPSRQLTDGSPTSPEGVGPVTRNAPSISTIAYQRWQFWDGRADTPWSQALVPMEAPNEYGSSRLVIAHAVLDRYRDIYEPIFGAMPALDDTTRFPPTGKPGDPQWEAMAPADQQAVTQIFVNVGKSVAAFERAFTSTDSPLSAYIRGDGTQLTGDQKDGLLAFLQAGCAQCHWGPRMTDDSFHVMRFPAGTLTTPDRGRIDGVASYVASEFGAGSQWSDDPTRARPAPVAGPWTLGAFKTPTLRNVALTGPYGHGGNYQSLADVVELIRTGGTPQGSSLAYGTIEPWVPAFDASMTAKIAAFLGALDETYAN